MKYCIQCNISKCNTEYSFDLKSKDYISSICTQCLEKKKLKKVIANRVSVAEYGKRNPDKISMFNSIRRASRVRANVSWADKEKIEEIYALRNSLGADYHVDHIVPLNSKLVCGLHCEFNLEVILATVNQKKSNRVWPDMP